MTSVYRISDYLEIELSQKGFGAGVDEFLVGICCANLGGQEVQTGNVAGKKYTRSQRLVELQVNINHWEYTRLDPDSEELVEVLKRGVMATRDEVKAMRIKDFDVDAFYRQIEELIDERGWIKNPEKYRHPPREDPDVHAPTNRPEILMPEEAFWDLIHGSIEADTGGVEGQIAFLVRRLSEMTEEDMVGFEATLWELMKQSYHFNVIAVAIAIDGPARPLEADIRFRCRLILYGQDVFYAVLEDPNSFARILDNSGASDSLLSVADRAFARKFGRNTGRKTPSEVADARIHYDPDTPYHIYGEGWIDRQDFNRRYAPLLARYRKRSAPKTRTTADAAAQGRSPIPPSLMMPEDDFWDLVRKSIETEDASPDAQVARLEDRLATRSEKEIVGFELTLRELIRRSTHYNVLALLMTIEGMVTDDSLLYFQCRLVLYGRDVFYKVIDDPNKLAERLDNATEAEDLLSVADNAFLRQSGEDTDKELPRDVASAYCDYDLGGPMLGKPWTERGFAKRYAALLKLYRQ